METLVPDMTNAPDLPVVVEGIKKYEVSLPELMRAVRDVIKRHNKTREVIQQVLVGCCAVAFDVETHKKNVEPFTALVKGLQGADQKAIIGWIEKNAPAIWRTQEGNTKKFVFNASYKGTFDFDRLVQDKWWQYAKPANEVTSTIDFREQLDNMVKRLTREMEATGEKRKTIEHPEVLAELKALQGRLSAMEY